MKIFIRTFALLALCAPAWAGFDLKEDTASQEWCFVLLDVTDGTIHTGETIANTEIKLVLPGGTTETDKNSGGATEIGSTGRYCATFDATDTATAGSMTAVIRNTGSVQKEYVINVATDNWYDAKYGTVNLEVDVLALGGVVQSLTDLKDFADAGYTPGTDSVLLVDTVTTNTDLVTDPATALTAIHLDHLIAVDAADVVVDDSIIADIVSATSDYSTMVSSDDSLQAIRDRGDNAWTTGGGTGLSAIATGTAQSADATSIILASAETFADDDLIGAVVTITGGTLGVGGQSCITDYAGATDDATVETWNTTPTGTITYEITPGVSTSCPVQADGSGNFPADVQAVSGDATAATNQEAFFDGNGYAGTGNVIPTVTTLTGHTAQTGDNFVYASHGTVISAIDSGASTTSFVDNALNGGNAAAYNGAIIVFTSGNAKGIRVFVTGFTPGTDTITYSTAATAPSNSDTYVLIAK